MTVSGSITENRQKPCPTDKYGRPKAPICYDVVAKYELNRQRKECFLRTDEMKEQVVGRELPLRVDPAEPERCQDRDGLLTVPLVCIVLGVFLAVPYFFSFRKALLNYLLERRLNERGVSVMASIVFVGPNLNRKKSGKNPLMIRAQFTDPRNGQLIIAEALEVWHDPYEADISKDGFVEVVYDPEDPARCMIVLYKEIDYDPSDLGTTV